MADLAVHLNLSVYTDPTVNPLVKMHDYGDGSYGIVLVASGDVALKVRSPIPASNDPTNFPLIGLVGNGDGTYSPKVVLTSG